MLRLAEEALDRVADQHRVGADLDVGDRVDLEGDVAGRVGVHDDDVDRHRGHVEPVDALEDRHPPGATAAAAVELCRLTGDAAAEEHQRSQVDTVAEALTAGEDQRLVGAADVEEVADEEEEEEEPKSSGRADDQDRSDFESRGGEQADWFRGGEVVDHGIVTLG